MSRYSSFRRVALGIAFVFVAASFCGAQEEGRPRRGGGGFGFGGFGGTLDKVTLAGVEQVQKEIKVTEEQKPKIEAVLASYREESRGLFSEFGNLRDASREERDAAMAKVTEKRQKLAATFEKKIDAALEAPQIKRLNEIALQQKGPQGLTDAPVAAALKLSEEQVGKIKAIYKAQQDELRQLGRGGGGGGREAFAEIREKREKTQKESDTKAVAVLSEEQQKEFAALKGAAFELDQAALRRGRGQGRGDGGQGGGQQRRRPPVDDA